MGGQRAGDNTQVSSSKSVHNNNETMSRIMTDAEDAEEQGLGLQLFGLPDADHISSLELSGMIQLGLSPRPTERVDASHGRGGTEGQMLDLDWMKRKMDFVKPDGRKYHIYEKRLNPSPQPVLGPSIYARELAPGYVMQEMAKVKPLFKGFTNKHDLVTFYTTNKPFPGPSLAEMAAAAPSFADRLDSIHDASVALDHTVETLWRLKQSWSMQRPENSPWTTPLERPRALKQAPGRHYRTNVNVSGFISAASRQQDSYEITPGTIFRKGKEHIEIIGRWSMFKPETKDERVAPETFTSKTEITKELKRRLKGIEDNAQSVSLDPASTIDVEETARMLMGARASLANIEIELEGMRRELNVVADPSDHSNEGDEMKEQKPGLSQDMQELANRVEMNKAAKKKSNGTTFICLGNGKFMEVACHAGDLDAVDDDDLEDLIKKPKMKHLSPHRDCFNPLSKKSIRRG